MMKNALHLLIFSVLIFAGCNKEIIENDSEEQQILTNETNVYHTSMDTKIEGQYIIKLKNGAIPYFSNHKAKQIRSSKEYKQSIMSVRNDLVTSRNPFFRFDPKNIKSVFLYGLEGFVATLSDSEVAELRKDPRIESIENDYLIVLKKPNNPGNGNGGDDGGGGTGQETPWGITRIGGAGDGTGLTAWVIDSGIDQDHPDLNVDVNKSISFVSGDSSPDDGNGHGTHVAGTIGAINNDIGVVGVAAGANVVSVRVLGGDGTGDFSWTVQALDYINSIAQNGDVVNMSLGPNSPFIHPSTDAAVLSLAQSGVKIAIAAGNSYDNANLYTPAHNNHANIYTISAMADGDLWAHFSNYGTCVDYTAPGHDVKSTWLSGGYNTISGTSMASPHAAGMLLLGNITSDGNVAGAYWEVKGVKLTGKYAATDIFNKSVFRYDVDGNNDPIMHR